MQQCCCLKINVQLTFSSKNGELLFDFPKYFRRAVHEVLWERQILHRTIVGNTELMFIL